MSEPPTSDALNNELKRLRLLRKELQDKLAIVERQITDIAAAKQRLRREPPTGEFRGGSEEFVVKTHYLRPFINYWLSLGSHTKALAMRSNVSSRTINRIRKGKTEYATLSTADRLMAAMGIPDLLGTDECPIEINPYKQNKVEIPAEPPSQFYEE